MKARVRERYLVFLRSPKASSEIERTSDEKATSNTWITASVEIVINSRHQEPSGIDVKLPKLHVREVYCAEYVAFYGEATQYIGCESDIVAFVRCQTCLRADSLVEVLSYRETVGL